MLNHVCRGSGPNLVLQHGFLGGLGCFAPQIDHFAASHSVIAADLPGFAGSAKLAFPGSIEALSGSLVTLLDQLEVGRFSLLGHSLGGLVALQTALDIGDRVEKLVLYATSSRGSMPNRHESFEASIARIEREGIGVAAARIASTWFVAGDRAKSYQACLEAGRGVTAAAAIDCLRSLPHWDVTDRLADIVTPTLVIHGERDRSYGREEQAALVAGIGHAKRVAIPECAHNAHLEDTDQFNRVVSAFLDDSSACAS